MFACDNTMPTPTPTPTPDMAVIPPDMTLLNPAISTITPKQGPTTGGTAITITGTNFKSTATVKIGGIAATGVSVNGNTITATTAASTNVGPQDVVVDNGDGSTAATLAKGYNYFIGTLTFPAGANANTVVLNTNGPRGLSNIDLVGQGFPSIVTAMGTSTVMGVAMTGINVIPNSTPASTPNPPTFAATTGIPTVAGANTISTAVGDLDGNALQDVVVTNQAQNSVTVIFRTMATPPFTAVTIPMATGSFNQPSFAAIGDFDADGKVNDIAVTNAGNGTVSILKYNGNMAFVAGAGSPVNITTGTSGYAMASRPATSTKMAVPTWPSATWPTTATCACCSTRLRAGRLGRLSRPPPPTCRTSSRRATSTATATSTSRSSADKTPAF
ncbi:MAG: VCBS repeat-containing protein [Polyangia bacterium]